MASLIVDDVVDDTNNNETSLIVIHNGTETMKVGFSGEESPKIIPTVVGRPKHPGIMVGMDQKDAYVGDEAQSKRGALTLKYPIGESIICNWEDMEEIWRHSFYELQVSPKDRHVLMTEAPLNPRSNRERMASIMIETFQVEKLFITTVAELILRNATGINFNSGTEVSHATPLYMGYILPHAIQRTTIAGRDLTNYMHKLVIARLENGWHVPGIKKIEGWRVPGIMERLTLQGLIDIKETLCYVAEDLEVEMERFVEHPESIELYYETDRLEVETIKLGSERFQCPEILFDPTLIGKDSDKGIHVTIVRAVQLCDSDIQGELFENIVLSGGSTLFPFLAKRLKREIEKLDTKITNVNVSDGVSAWSAVSSIVINQGTHQKYKAIHRSEFLAEGPACMNKMMCTW